MHPVLTRLRHSPLTRNTGWMFLGYGSRILIQGLYFVLLARALGSDGLGVFAGTAALMNILAPFAGWGMGNVLIMKVARKPERYAAALGAALLLLGLSSLVLIALALVLSKAVLGTPLGVGFVLLLAVSELLLSRLLELSAQAFQAFEKLRATARLFVLASLLRLAAVGGFLLFTPRGGVEAWILWYSLATLTASLMAFHFMVQTLGRPNFRKLAGLELKDGFFFALGVSAKSVYTDIDKSMLLRLSTSDVTGVYTAGYRIIAMAFTPVQALLAASYSRFFQAGSRGVSSALLLARNLAVPAAAYGLLVGLGLFLAAPLMPLLLGPDFEDSAAVVRWLAVLPLIQSLHYLFADTLTGANLQAWRSGVQIAVAVLNVGLNLWLIRGYGWQGAAIATILCETLLACSLLGILAWHIRGRREAL